MLTTGFSEGIDHEHYLNEMKYFFLKETIMVDKAMQRIVMQAELDLVIVTIVITFEMISYVVGTREGLWVVLW